MRFKIFNKSSLVESKEDIQRFVDKFGQKRIPLDWGSPFFMFWVYINMERA